jgi:hypothetical protein
LGFPLLLWRLVGHFSDLGKKSQSHGPKCPDLQAHLGWEFWPGSKKGALEILENLTFFFRQNKTKPKPNTAESTKTSPIRV